MYESNRPGYTTLLPHDQKKPLLNLLEMKIYMMRGKRYKLNGYNVAQYGVHDAL